MRNKPEKSRLWNMLENWLRFFQVNAMGEKKREGLKEIKELLISKGSMSSITQFGKIIFKDKILAQLETVY